jgi:hypothetical protein
MSWAKSTDTTAFHPRLLRLASPRDARQLNEAWGFVHRALTWSGAHHLDGFLPEGLAVMLAPGRTTELVKVATKAGMLVRAKGPDGENGWRVVYDVDDLMHIRSKEEVEWERRHRQQLRDPEVWVPVRLRDGDACRYCSRVVKWNDNKSDRGGTLDHVEPDGDELVVACRRCNGLKQDRTPEAAGLILLPAPVEPYYSPATIARLLRHGVDVLEHQARTQQLRQRETQPSARDAAPQGAHAAASGTTDDRPTTDRIPIESGRRSEDSQTGSRRVGSGPGPDQVGSGSATAPRAGPARARGSRGRRTQPPTQRDEKG